MTITARPPSRGRFNQLERRSRRFLELDWRRGLIDAISGQSATFTRASGAYAIGSNGLWYRRSDARPRWHTVTANDGDPYTGVLLEKSSTNLALHSDDFSDTDWTKTDSTITADDKTSPDGTANADLVTVGTAGADAVSQGVTVTSGTTVAASVHLKRGDHDWVLLTVHDTSTAANLFRAWFNLSTGEVGTSETSGTGATLDDALIEQLGGGWYRCTIIGSIASQTDYTFAISSASADDSTTQDGSGTRWQWGAQVEESAYPTSYVPTTTATVTRSADYVTHGAPSLAQIIAAEGVTIATEFVEMGTSLASAAWWEIAGPSASSRPLFEMLNLGTDGQVIGLYDDNDVVNPQSVASGVEFGDHVRARTRLYLDSGTWKIQQHLSINGAAETAGTATSIGSDLPSAWSADTITIGAQAGGVTGGASTFLRLTAARGGNVPLSELLP